MASVKFVGFQYFVSMVFHSLPDADCQFRRLSTNVYVSGICCWNL